MRRGVGVVLVSAALLAGACGGGGDVHFDTRAALAEKAPGADVDTSGPATQGGLLPTGSSAGGGAGSVSSGGAGGGAGGAAAGGGPGSVIKLGTVLPLQGGQRDFGEPVLRTTQAFVDEINARGGVNGHPLQLIAYSACLVCQDEALTAARRLVEQDGVFALVNTYVMAVAFQPVIPYLVQKGVPLIQGGAENQTSDALSPVNFATLPPGLFYGKFLPKMVSQYVKVKRIAITYVNVPSEANGIPLLERELKKEGVEVVDKEPVEAAEDAVTNMDSIIIRMRTRGAEAALATNPVILIYGRLAAARQNWNVSWVGLAAWSRLGEEGCGRTCDDLVLTDTAGLSFVDRKSPQMQQYIDTLARRYPGGELTGHTLAAWIGMQLTVEVLARLPSPDRAAFIRTLNGIRNLDLGTSSPLTFSPDRHLGGSASTLLKFKDGKYIRVSDPLNFGEAQP